MKWRGIEQLGFMPSGRVRVRATAPCSVYEELNDGSEVLLAHFEGETRIAVTGERIRVETSGDFQFFDAAVNQTATKTTNEVFTSLDRPAPLSPEMLAVQQMMRRNEIERDLMRQQMERLHDAASRKTIAAKGNVPATKAEISPSSHDLGNGEKKPEKPKGRADRKKAPLPDDDVSDDA